MTIEVGTNKELAQAEIGAELLGIAIIVSPSEGHAWFESEQVSILGEDGRTETTSLSNVSPWSASEYRQLCELFPFHGVREAVLAGFYGSAVTIGGDGEYTVGIYAAEQAIKYFYERISYFRPERSLKIEPISTEEQIIFAQTASSHGGTSISPVGGFGTGRLAHGWRM